MALNKRIIVHMSDCKTRKFKFNRSPVAAYFSESNHTFDNIILYCIDANKKWYDETRKLRETYWIMRLNTLQQHGININDK